MLYAKKYLLDYNENIFQIKMKYLYQNSER